MNWLDDYGVQEYLLVVNPSKEVTEKIWQEKKKFKRDFYDPMAVITQPHITRH
jgi:hypothetical protein